MVHKVKPRKEASRYDTNANPAEGERRGRKPALQFSPGLSGSWCKGKGSLPVVGHRQSSHFQGDTGVLNNRYKRLQVQGSQVYVSGYLPAVTICSLSSNTLLSAPSCRPLVSSRDSLTGFGSPDTPSTSSRGAGDPAQAHEPISCLWKLRWLWESGIWYKVF